MNDKNLIIMVVAAVAAIIFTAAFLNDGKHAMGIAQTPKQVIQHQLDKTLGPRTCKINEDCPGDLGCQNNICVAPK